MIAVSVKHGGSDVEVADLDAAAATVRRAAAQAARAARAAGQTRSVRRGGAPVACRPCARAPPLQVAALKERLEAATGVFARHQKLIFKGKVRRPGWGGVGRRRRPRRAHAQLQLRLPLPHHVGSSAAAPSKQRGSR
jgi:hypothetical protein